MNIYPLLNVFARNEKSHKEFEKFTEVYINKITRLEEKKSETQVSKQIMNVNINTAMGTNIWTKGKKLKHFS